MYTLHWFFITTNPQSWNGWDWSSQSRWRWCCFTDHLLPGLSREFLYQSMQPQLALLTIVWSFQNDERHALWQLCSRLPEAQMLVFYLPNVLRLTTDMVSSWEHISRFSGLHFWLWLNLNIHCLSIDWSRSLPKPGTLVWECVILSSFYDLCCLPPLPAISDENRSSSVAQWNWLLCSHGTSARQASCPSPASRACLAQTHVLELVMPQPSHPHREWMCKC